MRLVNKYDIQEFRPISKSTSDKKINTFIDDAQILDLKPLMGEKFFFEVLANYNNYYDLLNEKEYQFDGAIIISPGLKKVLVYFSYARYQLFGSQTDTAFGTVEKNFQDGNHIDRINKKEVYKQTQQMAYQYWEEIERYLNRNQDLYPLWKKDSCIGTKRNSTFRLNKISR